jgi:outer membrane biosynthesis protein TonB
MARAAASTLALALGVLAALALASCGGSDAKLLPGNTAAEITENLDAVKQLAAERECESAEAAAEEVSAQVESLKGVDPKLKEALSEGAVRLNEVIGTCQEEEVEEPVETETLPTVPESTETKPDKKKPKKEETAPETTEPETETTEETEESELPPQAEGEGKGKGHEVPPGQEEGPSGGIGPGHETGGED